MADSYLTVSDFVADKLDVLQTTTSNILNDAPFVSQLLRLSPSGGGTTHKFTVYTTEPTVGFRSENAGRNMSESADTVTTLTMKILDFSWVVDQATANGWARGSSDLIAREGARHLGAALFKWEKQIFNGTVGVGDSSGHTGFRNSTYLDATTDGMVTSAGGSTANTGSSVYLIRLGQDDVAGVTSDDFMIGDTVSQMLGAADGYYPAYVTPASIWTALQMGGAYSVGRIANLTADSGKGLTDTLIATSLMNFPAARMPNLIVMNRRSLKQLQAARTATNSTGAPAPFPTEAFGIPIIVTDAISSTEALIS
jgi:hypothetical protein